MASNTRNLTSPQQQPPTQLRPGAQNVSFASNTVNRQSGAAALGLGLMEMDDSDSDDDDDRPAPAATRAVRPTSPGIPIAAPKPGYVTQPINLARPEPALSPSGRSEMVQLPSELAAQPPRTSSTEPHPLRAPMTPIQPVFARPKKVQPAVEFQTPIIRGNSEDVLIPKRGEKGDDFWRRFSMVVHEDEKKKPNEKTSKWLSKTQGGNSRMSRWVWCTGFMILVLIGAIVGFSLYFSRLHHSTVQTAPRTVGGQAGNHTLGPVDAKTHAGASVVGSTTILQVTPTRTVARRSETTGSPASRMHAAMRKRQSRIHHLD